MLTTMRLGKKWMIFFGSTVIFGVLSFKLPYYTVSREVASLVVSVTGILFGLISSFFISEMWGKYTSIRDLSGQFKGSILMLIDSVKMLDGNEDFKERFMEEMEKYLIAYHIVPWHKVELEGEYFQNVIDTVEDVEINSETDPNTYLKILTTSHDIRKLRNRMINTGKAKLLPMEWISLLTLTGIFVTALFILRDGSFILNILSTILPSVTVLIIIFLYDLDKLNWGVNYISFEPGEAALDAIGRKRFYDTRFLEKGVVNPPTEDYRTEEDLEGELREVYDEIMGKEVYHRTNNLLN